jgi:hypothetical protein
MWISCFYVFGCVFPLFEYTIMFIKIHDTPFCSRRKTMESQKIRATTILAILGLGVILSTVVFGILSASQTVQNSGNIKTVGVSVYSDSGCNQKLSTINWGTLTAGTKQNLTQAYIRNEGTVATTLTMTTGNWSSTQASTYIKLSWTLEGYKLPHQTTSQATLTLTVPSNITGVDSFSFDVTITGTEVT